jgi:hypothetical protein
MYLPGRAWLEFEVKPMSGGSQIRQTAYFDPKGIAGLTYWYAVYPLHQILFAGMLRGILQAANQTTKLHSALLPAQQSGHSPGNARDLEHRYH